MSFRYHTLHISREILAMEGIQKKTDAVGGWGGGIVAPEAFAVTRVRSFACHRREESTISGAALWQVARAGYSLDVGGENTCCVR